MKIIITILTLCAMLVAPCWFADAQQTGKVFRMGFLDNSTASGSAVLVDAFWQELGKLGWIEGKNITIEYRFAEHKNAHGVCRNEDNLSRKPQAKITLNVQ
jgi:hypothetical protein